jgi:NAD(P)-dependent dehydrogenase (short-subunit alcohol dehydrogenase family)
VDVVINNAGYGNISSVEDTPMSDFRAQIETNLFGTIIVTKAALPYFRQRKAGHFVQFTSMGARIGPPGRGPHSAAKWGVEGFSEVLSREVAPLGIKVTIIEPGGFRTDFAGSSTKLSEGIPNTTRLLEQPPGFSATTTLSSPVTRRRRLKRSFSRRRNRNLRCDSTVFLRVPVKFLVSAAFIRHVAEWIDCVRPWVHPRKKSRCRLLAPSS